MAAPALSLTDAIKAVADGVPRHRRGRRPHLPEPSLTQALKTVAGRKRNPPATRTGRKGIVIYVAQDVAAAIHRLADDYDTTVQALGETAFKYLFEKLRRAVAGLRAALGRASRPAALT